MGCLQKEPGFWEKTVVGCQVRPWSWERRRRIWAVSCMEKLPVTLPWDFRASHSASVMVPRLFWAVCSSHRVPSFSWKKQGFCSEHWASSDSTPSYSQRSAPARRRAATMEMSLLPSARPANQAQSRSPFSSSIREEAWFERRSVGRMASTFSGEPGRV